MIAACTTLEEIKLRFSSGSLQRQSEKCRAEQECGQAAQQSAPKERRRDKLAMKNLSED